MKKEHTLYRQLFQKFLRNECSEEEKKQVMWLLQQPEQDNLFREVIDQSMDDESGMYQWNSFAKQKVFAKTQQRKAAVRRQSFRTGLWQVAASVALVIGFGILVYFLGARIGLSDKSGSYTDIYVPFGEKRQLTLPDGSIVHLNAGSALRYPENYGETQRTLQLNGEAFFEVIRDEERPFVVQTGDIFTRVLGTSFNVDAYMNEEKAIITVASGKVQIRRRDSLSNETNVLTTLSPDQQVRLDKLSGSHNTYTVVAKDYLAWRDGKLIFQNATFQEVARALERRYNVTVGFQNEGLKKCRFTARFDETASIREVLELLLLVNKGDYKSQSPGIYKLYGEPCSQ